MPKRTDIEKIMIVGSGPIVIGQACEFDYSGTQACKALRDEGYETVLVNSNPATIMTDPELAERTYIEPLTTEYLRSIIERERPQALLSTVGGQTGLNASVALAEKGILDEFGVELIGANLEAIRRAEDRQAFKVAMTEIGLEVARSRLVSNVDDGLEFASEVGYPVVLRPSFTLGGTGGGMAYNSEEMQTLLRKGLDLSPVREVLVEESVLGWKEYEMEVMRDLADNAIIICSIENFDMMGVHTGDSITVAPAQTLTDREYQLMRDASLACLRKIGVDTGGSNVQFSVNPETGRMLVIEMNPRVSRSSALASKATGFPIAKIAAKLAVGLRLDEIPNDITRKTPASFEPSIDYVVVKIPKWQFEKFPGSEPVLGVQMKSIGEVMAIGSTFKHALWKAIRSLETGRKSGTDVYSADLIPKRLITPNPDRLNYIRFAMAEGLSVSEVQELTDIDPWFLSQIKTVVDFQQQLARTSLDEVSPALLRQAKRYGLSDNRLGRLWNETETAVRNRRKEWNIRAVFKRVDTCAAEFESFTPYLYSVYEEECEAAPGDGRKVMILGSGPNRIGQGIEFDYCCCHASFALQELGCESIMVNCNPETVSTDYDTSDRLYFEPLTLENVLNICDTEEPDGVIVQFGGQTPLTLALPLKAHGVPIIGTDPESIDLAEDRDRFGRLLNELDIPQPAGGTATSADGALETAKQIGYPVLVRPSYVLGGRAMVIAYDAATVESYMRDAVVYSQDRPILVDRFLENAIEVDVDALCDGQDVVIGGIMEHIEEAGVHSGDSSCVLPAQTIPANTLETIADYTARLARALNVIGLMNVQFAIHRGRVYVIEVNPRASRTVPYVSKATGVPLAKIAVNLMMGRKLAEFGLPEGVLPAHEVCVKSPVFPFNKFTGVDPLLGPEMRSTGEVMGIGSSFGEAFAKAQLSAGQTLPDSGSVFLSVNSRQVRECLEMARQFAEFGFQIYATRGTATTLRGVGLKCRTVMKVNEGRPNALDLIADRKVDLIVNTPAGPYAFEDEKKIRGAAIQQGIPSMTTLSAAKAAVNGIAARRKRAAQVSSLQELYSKASSVTA
ncbi:MAG: carbamoyl-phosphate synthase large subunit [Bryobacterales bacterium]|nr:carbamoyl-phosphate synthase large subunit [Bryobacterales bacterium]